MHLVNSKSIVMLLMTIFYFSPTLDSSAEDAHGSIQAGEIFFDWLGGSKYGQWGMGLIY